MVSLGWIDRWTDPVDGQVIDHCVCVCVCLHRSPQEDVQPPMEPIAEENIEMPEYHADAENRDMLRCVTLRCSLWTQTQVETYKNHFAYKHLDTWSENSTKHLSVTAKRWRKLCVQDARASLAASSPHLTHSRVRLPVQVWSHGFRGLICIMGILLLKLLCLTTNCSFRNVLHAYSASLSTWSDHARLFNIYADSAWVCERVKTAPALTCTVCKGSSLYDTVILDDLLPPASQADPLSKLLDICFDIQNRKEPADVRHGPETQTHFPCKLLNS